MAMRYQYKPTKMTTNEKASNIMSWQGYGKTGKLIYCWQKYKLAKHFRKLLGVIYDQLNQKFQFQIYTQEEQEHMPNKKNMYKMYIGALYLNIKNCHKKQNLEKTPMFPHGLET